MNTPELKRLIVFCILMENDDGIVGKSPGYIYEKFDYAVNVHKPEWLLDQANRRKLDAWEERWRTRSKPSKQK